TDRVSLVTGASRGIGRAAARVLAEAGSDLVLVGRDESALNLVGEEIQAAGRTALIIVGDVAERDTPARAVQGAISRFGRLDILVNNAGILNASPIEGVDDETWDAVITVNLTAAYRLCREAFAP